MKIKKILSAVFIASILSLASCYYANYVTPSDPVYAETVALDETTLTMAVDQTHQLTYSVTPTGASTTGISWKSSNSAVLSVSDGLLTAKEVTDPDNPVTVTIKTRTGNYSDTCSVKIVEELIPAINISISSTSLTMTRGETATLAYTFSPSDSTSVVYWSSSSPNVATVQGGKVTAVENGSTIITATTDNGKTASCNVTVKVIAVTSIKLEANKLDIYEGITRTLKATILPSNATDQSIIWSSTNPEFVYVSPTGTISAKAIGTATITATASNGYSDSCRVNVVEAPKMEKSTLSYDYTDYTKNNAYTIDSMPSIGSPKILVIPIWFTDSSNYINESKKEAIRVDIQTSYFGTNEDTGWRSVKTYYEEESFGECNMTGFVAGWYNCNKSSKSVNDTTSTNNLVKSAVNWYKSTHDDISSFDTDGDGYIDGTILVYGAPDYITGNHSNSNLWGYTYWIQQSKGTASNPVPNSYFWASYDFMYGSERSDVSYYYGGDTSHCYVDTHTFIHEMGHIFGLSDLYDYNNGFEAAGGYTMQDYNVGGHDPYSEMALGWYQPYVPTNSITLKIYPSQASGDIILLSPYFTGSPFDEYILIDLYTNTGVNQFDSTYAYRGNYPSGTTNAGCRIWHIDARLTYWSSFSGFSGIGTIPANNCYHATTNTSSGSEGGTSPLGGDYLYYREVNLIRKNYTKDYKCNYTFSNDSLFYSGDSFDMVTYGNCFYNNGLLNSGDELGWRVYFDTVTSEYAIITISHID